MPTRVAEPEAPLADALLRGLAGSAAALCLCDAHDLIRYANPAFTAAFFPSFDGHPVDFMEAITAAMAAGTGIRLVSATPADFAQRLRRVRREMAGSRSFTTDLDDGSWWSVTDTKLPDGSILSVAQDISALKREEARLRDAHDTALTEANTDHLTGAPNRRHGLRHAEALWSAARDAGDPLAVALMDIDHFKAINDAYGHEAGDRALVHLAQAVTAAIRPEDAFARLGGDEFLLVRPRSDACRLEAALGEVLAGLTPLPLGRPAEALRLSVSVGIAEARGGETWPELMHRADMALYGAKAGGRDRIASAA